MNEVTFGMNTVSEKCLEDNTGSKVRRINSTSFSHEPSGSVVKIDYSPAIGCRASVTMPLTYWLATFGRMWHDLTKHYDKIQVVENVTLATPALRHDK